MKKVCLFLCFIAYFVLIAVSYQYTVDDAYITYAYARNLRDGKGLSFNEGENVEGFTSPLHLAIISLCPQKSSIPLAGKLTGIISGLIILAYLYCHTKSILLLASITALPSFIISGVNGLETMLFTMILSIFLLSRFIFFSKNLSLILIPFLVIVRPEGLIIAVCTIILDLILRNHDRRYRVLSLVILIISALMLFSSRYLLFGELLPNTYYAKAHQVFSMTRFYSGLIYMIKFNIKTMFIPLILFIILIIRSAGNYKKNRHVFSLIIIILIYIAVIMYEGGDWIPFGRFIVPVIPVLFFLIFYKLNLKKAYLPLIIIFFLSQAATGIYEYSYVNDRAKGYRYAHMEIAQYIKRNYGAGIKTALMDIGIFKYYSGAEVFDIIGLTNKSVSRDPENLTAYIKSFDPDIFILVSDRSYKDGFHSFFRRDQMLYDNFVSQGRYTFLLERDHFRFLNSNRTVLFIRRLFRGMSKESRYKGYYLVVFARDGLQKP